MSCKLAVKSASGTDISGQKVPCTSQEFKYQLESIQEAGVSLPVSLLQSARESWKRLHRVDKWNKISQLPTIGSGAKDLPFSSSLSLSSCCCLHQPPSRKTAGMLQCHTEGSATPFPQLHIYLRWEAQSMLPSLPLLGSRRQSQY